MKQTPRMEKQGQSRSLQGAVAALWRGAQWVWQAVGKQEMDEGLLPQNLPGLTQLLSGRAVSRKVPLELVAVKCIILKCISRGAPGARKAGTGTHPGLLSSWGAATPVTLAVCS